MGAIKNLFGGGKSQPLPPAVTAPPPPPPPPPETKEQPVQREARMATRSRAKSVSNRRRTILTSPQGLPSLRSEDTSGSGRKLGK
jgi:type IV secretory pathway VirB10-like protein